MPTDKQLVSKQEHEIKYLLKKWNIKRPELLEIKGKKRSRKVIEKLLIEKGITLRKPVQDQKFRTQPAAKKVKENPI
jgi:hypothetical protein